MFIVESGTKHFMLNVFASLGNTQLCYSEVRGISHASRDLMLVVKILHSAQNNKKIDCAGTIIPCNNSTCFDIPRYEESFSLNRQAYNRH